jgi:hypothetical protein
MARFGGILAPWVAVYLPDQVSFYLPAQACFTFLAKLVSFSLNFQTLRTLPRALSDSHVLLKGLGHKIECKHLDKSGYL